MVAPEGMGWPTAPVARPMVVPGANGSVGKTEVSSAEPPRSAAGFVQSTSPVVGRPGA